MTTKKRIVLFLSKHYPDILTGLISFGVSFTETEWYYKLLMCFIPWIICYFIVKPAILKSFNKSYQESVAQCIRRIQIKGESFLKENIYCIKVKSSKDIEEELKLNYKLCCVDFCNTLKNYFIERFSYSDLVISVKANLQGQNIIELSRDSDSPITRDICDFLHKPHPVNENTAFLVINNKYKDGEVCIYRASKIKEKFNKGKYHCSRGKEYGVDNIPYNSICVFPILPLINPSHKVIAGYVCIDAVRDNLFDEKTDKDETIFYEVVSGMVEKILAPLFETPNFQSLISMISKTQ